MHSQHYLIRNALTDTNSTCAISGESFKGTSLHWEQERSVDESGDRERALHHPAALAGESWVGELLQFDGGLLVPHKASSL